MSSQGGQSLAPGRTRKCTSQNSQPRPSFWQSWPPSVFTTAGTGGGWRLFTARQTPHCRSVGNPGATPGSYYRLTARWIEVLKDSRRRSLTRSRQKEFHLKKNQCLECHSELNFKEIGTTQVHESHYVNRAGERLGNVSTRYYFCNQCHVEQANKDPARRQSFYLYLCV